MCLSLWNIVLVPSILHCVTAFQSRNAFAAPERIRLPFVSVSKQLHVDTETLRNNQYETARSQLEEQAAMDTRWDDDPLEVVRHFTETAIKHRGRERGLEALESLSDMCRVRSPYDFRETNQQSGTVVSSFRELLPQNVSAAFLDQVRAMEANGWFSKNPDSVDGLPSLHINLVTDGKPAVPSTDAKQKPNNYELGVQTLLSLVSPYIYDELLPEVNRLLNTTTIQVSEVFLRRYGEDICGSISRNGIGAHYDVFSRVTSVIALDDVAAHGTNGLYTTYKDEHGKTSNHASLRRFFPLSKGDAVVHTWDVLHGVNVESGLDRTSLIVWFTTEDQTNQQQEGSDYGVSIAPWITNHSSLDKNDVAQFVLASALYSNRPSNPPSLATEDVNEFALRQHQLYLRSAAQGNTFSLTRMGSLCAEGALSTDLETEALEFLESLRPEGILPEPIRSSTDMSLRFWFEGAVYGNPLAQQSLANELMVQASHTGDNDTYLLAAVLFALAAQQGSEDAIDALSRVIEFDMARRDIRSEEEFLASPVVQVAQAATM